MPAHDNFFYWIPGLCYYHYNFAKKITAPIEKLKQFKMNNSSPGTINIGYYIVFD